jgi:NADPH2:quinone reductase
MIANYHTAYFARTRRAHLKGGETVTRLGSARGIGTTAVPVAICPRAKVSACLASREQFEVAAAAGERDMLVLQEAFAHHIRALTGRRGVDPVLDRFGSWLFTEATRALAPNGRTLIVRFTAGDIPTIKANRLLRNIAAIDVAAGAFLDVGCGIVDDTASASGRLFEQGVARPYVRARSALRSFLSRSSGSHTSRSLGGASR